MQPFDMDSTIRPVAESCLGHTARPKVFGPPDLAKSKRRRGKRPVNRLATLRAIGSIQHSHHKTVTANPLRESL
jgi:hypothetical protein